MRIGKLITVSALLLCTTIILWTPQTNAQLIPYLYEDSYISVVGERQSNTAWGLGPVNYTAGWTAQDLFPDTGWMQLGILGLQSDESGCTDFGCGSGYKAFFQMYCDADNVLAFGIIYDPGVALMIGGRELTIMIEGLANGQPVAGYWPLGSIDQGDYHDFYVEWGPSYVKFMVDAQQSLVYQTPMTVDQVSFSFLGAARLPGDMIHASFAIYDWSLDLGDLMLIGFTWDTSRLDSTPDFITSAFYYQ